jgi:hypothetical protein
MAKKDRFSYLTLVNQDIKFPQLEPWARNTQQKRRILTTFDCVCPEPVLAK